MADPIIADEFLGPGGREKFLSFLESSPLNSSGRVALKKRWEALTGEEFTPEEWERILGIVRDPVGRILKQT